MKTTVIPHFAGMNNRLPDFVSKVGEAHFLRNAVNVDLTNAGTVKRRKGSTLFSATNDGHSFHANDTNSVGWFVDYRSLKSVTLNNDGTPNVATLMNGTLVPARRGWYDDTPLGTVFSNGDVLKLVTAASATDLTFPLANPLLSSSTGGALAGGVYQVAVAQIDPVTGQQGGTGLPSQIVVPDNGKLIVSGLNAAKRYAVYVTPTNGEIFLLAATIQATSITFAAPITYGPECQTLLLAPMPPGALLRYSNGRLYTVVGNVLYYSEPYAPALHNPARGYIPFPEPITMVETVNDGVYVAADQTYFIGGVITDSTAKPVVPYGAVYGASGRIESSVDVFWMSQRGVIRASPGGTWKNLTEDVVVTDPAHSGAVLYRAEDGMKQFINTLFNPTTSVAAAKTWMDAEVVRRDDSLPGRSMPSALVNVATTMDGVVLLA